MDQVVPSVSSSGPTQSLELALPDADIQLSLQQVPLEQVPLTWSDTDECGTDGRLSCEVSQSQKPREVVGPCVFPEEGTRLWAETSAFWRMLDLVLASAMVPSLFVTLKSTLKFCFKHIDA
ncbi:hypothetical protein D623_10009697 [Myotis brandtii]|uniref:Uncharacterized protein n=1 Tax=Myotis brandtii TaxID=109478 RepID=S7PFD0_MYOBR|nr:hypothetical protein D623_10009697 [Myotis brandtii]